MNSEFIDYLKSKGYAHSSLSSMKKIIEIYFKWLEKQRITANQITYNDLLIFMKYCANQGIKQRTIQSYMNVIHQYYDHLVREKEMDNNPASEVEVKGIKKKSLYYILEPHELNSLYNQYNDESLQGKRNRVMLGLLVYQGLKTAELSKLELNDIKLREGKIEVPGSKSSNGRMMQLESHQVMDLYDYILQVRPALMKMKPKRSYQKPLESNQLFIGEGGCYQHFNNFMTRLMVRLRKMHPKIQNAQQLRASVITKWLKMHNLRETQYLAGHRYISSTENYLQNDMEGLKEEVQQFHPLG